MDLSTGEFLTTEGSHATIDKLLNSFQPKEVIYPRGQEARFHELFGNKFYIYPIEEWFFDRDAASERLEKHFEVNSLKGFGIEHMNCGISSAGAILNYLEITKHDMFLISPLFPGSTNRTVSCSISSLFVIWNYYILLTKKDGPWWILSTGQSRLWEDGR